MGFVLPSPDSPSEKARALMARKDDIQAELDTQYAILSTNSSTMQTPLVDPDGFPRGDVDVYAVRHARVRIIELRNDLEKIMNDIAKALEGVYNPAATAATPAVPNDSATSSRIDAPAEIELTPFAKVENIAPGSPAADAGLHREDLLLQFGHLTSASFTRSSLQPLTELVAAHENRPLSMKVQRGDDETLSLSLTPRKGWGGRGMLGCYIVPYVRQ